MIKILIARPKMVFQRDGAMDLAAMKVLVVLKIVTLAIQSLLMKTVWTEQNIPKEILPVENQKGILRLVSRDKVLRPKSYPGSRK